MEPPFAPARPAVVAVGDAAQDLDVAPALGCMTVQLPPVLLATRLFARESLAPPDTPLSLPAIVQLLIEPVMAASTSSPLGWFPEKVTLTRSTEFAFPAFGVTNRPPAKLATLAENVLLLIVAFVPWMYRPPLCFDLRLALPLTVAPLTVVRPSLAVLFVSFVPQSVR